MDLEADTGKLCPCHRLSLNEDSMIFCDACQTWYHGFCVSLSHDQVQDLSLDKYHPWLCPACTDLSVTPVSDDTDHCICPLCPSEVSKKFKGTRGLKIHYSRKHPDQLCDLDNDNEISSFAKSLSYLKDNVKVLKRIPKGARFAVANKLSLVLDQCHIKNDKVSWMKLLKFVYGVLCVPDKKSQNLVQFVKRNSATYDNVSDIPSTQRVKSHRIIKKSTNLARRVELKVSEGDIKGAVKLLSSSDTLATKSQETYEKLLSKHPAARGTQQFPLPPSVDSPLQVSAKTVLESVHSFPNGSASGVDGLRAQHLKDLLSPANGEASTKLLVSLTNVTNLMLSGKVNDEILPILYGGNLFGFNKKDGGLRPISVGMTLRRLTAKLGCQAIQEQLSAYFQPIQMGFGTKGGSEVAVHATRTFCDRNSHSDKVILKIDFQNAFNSIDRDVMLTRIKEEIPSLYPFLWQCYRNPSFLFFDEQIILSQVGAMQGDPAGCVAFSLCIHPIISQLSSELNVWYLDDGTLGGHPDTVLTDFKSTIQYCERFGLKINPAKCELFFCGNIDQDAVTSFSRISPGIRVTAEKLSLLGSPITDDGFEEFSQHKFDEISLLIANLHSVQSHIAYYLLRHCFLIPKFNYLLRTTPLWKHSSFLQKFDLIIKSALEGILNISLDNNKWSLATLPVRYGGIGIRKLEDICLPAFLSSVHGIFGLIQLMLPNYSQDMSKISYYAEAVSVWQANYESIPTSPSSQRNWESIACSKVSATFSFTKEDQALYLASLQKESSAWLNAVPSKKVGTLLTSNVFRISISLRLGLKVCVPHLCVCGQTVNQFGRHGLSCTKSAGRHSRHYSLNNIIHRALLTAKVPSTLEPLGTCRDDGKRPDGMTIIPWKNGEPLIWDATCSDTLAPSYIDTSSKEAGLIAEQAALKKIQKYSEVINQGYVFLPFAVETMGPLCKEALAFVKTLGLTITGLTGEPRSTAFLLQRIGIAIQQGNAACVMGTIPPTQPLDAIFYL